MTQTSVATMTQTSVATMTKCDGLAMTGERQSLRAQRGNPCRQKDMDRHGLTASRWRKRVWPRWRKGVWSRWRSV